MSSRMDPSSAGAERVTSVTEPLSAPRPPSTGPEAWTAVAVAIAEAAREIFSSDEFRVTYQKGGERLRGGSFERIKVVVAEVHASRILGIEMPWNSDHAFLEIKLSATSSPRFPLQVGALFFATTNPDGKAAADLIAAKAVELIKERGLERLVPTGQPQFQVVQKF